MEVKAAVCSDFSLASHSDPSGGAQQFETNLCTNGRGRRIQFALAKMCVLFPHVFLQCVFGETEC